MSFTLQEQIAMAPIPTPEHMLGKGSMMPFNPSNSGGRKLMYGVNLEQRLPLTDPDVPWVGTGFEYQFGQYSSSYIQSKENYEIVNIISKFSHSPNLHRYYLLYDRANNMLDVIESCDYKHFTENYGLLYNHSYLDSLRVGSFIPKDQAILKSRAFDEYDNRMDGKNLLILYTACEGTMEDGIIISESCAKKLTSPLIHKIRLVINDNDIPLNLYGTKDNYKIMPDVGETVSINNGIVMGYRREKKEESLYSLAYDRLMGLSLSDEKITCSGRVMNIDVYSNDPTKLNGSYYGQIKYYWNEQIRWYNELVQAVKPFIDSGVQLSYNLQVLYYKCDGILQGKQFFNDRVFSNLNVEVTIIEEIPVNTGDKLTNRYGGKGVVSEIRPDYMMPKTYNGETFDILANKEGIYGRENMGQLFELSVTAAAKAMVELWAEESMPTHLCYAMYLEFLKIVSPSSYEEVDRMFSGKSDDAISELIGSIILDGCINVEVLPMSENMTIDKVIQLKRTFPWMEQEHILTTLEDSNGDYRYVISRRPVVVGYVYYYRLKQYAKEKFSVTSLSATNIRNENSRNKASKNYKAPFSRTPIGFGYMEIGDMSHIGHAIMAEVLMLYASSPLARESYEKLMTGDPFNVDIRLDDNASNRSAEIVETLLKSIGKRIVFEKVKKEKKCPIEIPAVMFFDKDEDLYEPITILPKGAPEGAATLLREIKERYLYHPIKFYPIKFTKPPEQIKKELKEKEHERLRKLAQDLEASGEEDFERV